MNLKKIIALIGNGEYMEGETRPISTNFLTTLSGIAILMVVIVHLRVFYYADAYLQGDYGFIVFTQLSLTDRIIELLTRYPVPLFVFAWGFKFSYFYCRRRGRGTQYNWVTYFISLAKQFLIPYLLWSVAYLVGGFTLDRALAMAGLGEPGEFFTRQQLLGILTTSGNYAYQLWFLPMLLFTSVMIITFHYIFKKRWALYIVYAMYFAAFLVFPEKVEEVIPFGLWLRYFLNFEMGMHFGERYFRENRVPRLWPVLALWVLTIALRLPNQDSLPDHILDTVLLVISPVVWYALVGMFSRPNARGLFFFLGRYSWSVYLLHAPLLNNVVHSVSARLGLVSPWYDLPKAALIIAIAILVSRALYAFQFKISQPQARPARKTFFGRVLTDVGNYFI